MIKRNIPRFVLILLVLLILISAVYAIAAGNTVPVTYLSDQSISVSINDLAPPECAGLNLTNVIVVSGWLTGGTDEGDLILGRNAGDYIFGGAGDDCIVGGGGNDSLYGGESGNDVCIGGPGNDSFPNFFIIFPVENGCETPID